MEVIPTLFKEVLIIKPKLHFDHRGSFSEKFNRQDFIKHIGYQIDFCQDNITHSKRGVLRGLHYQLHPHAQSKLVSVIKGTVLDIIVDIRKGSPTFGKHFSKELSENNHLNIFIPRGFAHGYITLSKKSIFQYKVDQYYHPESEITIAPNDPELGINWILPESEWLQSDKDKKQLMLKETILFDYNKDMNE